MQKINWLEEFKDAGFLVIEAEAQEVLTAGRHEEGYHTLTEEEVVETIYGLEHEDEEKDGEEMAERLAVSFDCDAAMFVAARTQMLIQCLPNLYII